MVPSVLVATPLGTPAVFGGQNTVSQLGGTGMRYVRQRHKQKLTAHLRAQVKILSPVLGAMHMPAALALLAAPNSLTRIAL